MFNSINNVVPQNVPNTNNIVNSNQQEQWDDVLSNTSMRIAHQHRRAAAEQPPRPAGHQLTTDQRVNDRLAELGEEATARRSGAQGVYNPQHNNNNSSQYQYGNNNENNQTIDNQYRSQPFYNGYIPIPHGQSSQGEFPSAPMRRISSGRDRTGSDGIARLAVPWPNEHCLIGIDRRKVTYDNLTHPQWQAGLMNILAMEGNPLCKKTMLNHITRLSQDVVDCGFRAARGAHAAVLVALEEGRVSWLEPEAIEGIRRDSISRVYFEAEVPTRSSFAPRTSTTAPSKPQGGTKTHSVCKLYNKGTCSSQGDHTVGNVLYKHICSFCKNNGKSYPHTELACQKKHDKGNT